MSPVKIDGAKRQLFSLVKSQNTKLLEAAQKKKKPPTPPADSPDAAEAAAEPPETDAAEAGVEEEGGSEQPAAVGQKKKKMPQMKKEKSASVKAEGGKSMGQPMKRKRKDDSDAKVAPLTDVMPACCMAPYNNTKKSTGCRNCAHLCAVSLSNAVDSYMVSRQAEQLTD